MTLFIISKNFSFNIESLPHIMFKSKKCELLNKNSLTTLLKIGQEIENKNNETNLKYSYSPKCLAL